MASTIQVSSRSQLHVAPLVFAADLDYIGDVRASTQVLVSFVIVFHLVVFVVEAFLWMQPRVHEAVLHRLSTSAVPAGEQALILRSVLINQGFYNLFLATAAFSGLRFVRSGHETVGRALVVYACLTALAAGIVLASTTTAYIGACLQSLPAALVLVTIRKT